MDSRKHGKILSATTTGDYVVCGSDIGTVHCFNLKQRFDDQRERYADSEVDVSGDEDDEENAMVVEDESSPSLSPSSDPSDEFCMPSACGAVYDMEILGAGKLLACAGDDSINIWRWSSLLEHAGQNQDSSSGMFNPSTRLIPHSVSSLARGARPPIPEANSIVCTSPSGTQLLAGYGDSRVRVWDIASGKCVRTLRGEDEG